MLCISALEAGCNCSGSLRVMCWTCILHHSADAWGLPDRNDGCLSTQSCQVRATVVVGCCHNALNVCFGQPRGLPAEQMLQQGSPSLRIWHGDVDPLDQPPPAAQYCSSAASHLQHTSPCSRILGRSEFAV